MKKLIQMIMESPSIEPEEKQQRIDLLQVMKSEHIDRLQDILTREKKKLKEIQDRYDKKKKAVIKKTLKENNITSLTAI